MFCILIVLWCFQLFCLMVISTEPEQVVDFLSVCIEFIHSHPIYFQVCMFIFTVYFAWRIYQDVIKECDR